MVAAPAAPHLPNSGFGDTTSLTSPLRNA